MTMAPIVLLVDDEPNVTTALKRRLRNESYEIVTASSGREALAILERQDVDLIVSDEQMPGMRGSELLAIVNQRYPETIRMILTGHASLDAAIRAINEGEIYRFFLKPCNEVDLVVSIRHALEQKRLERENRRLERQVRRATSLLEALERDNPGISNLEVDDDGAVVIDVEELDEEPVR
jgi:DNA-binding NtrC family response regulator